MKKIILVLMTICSLQVVYAQKIDQATVNKIRVKLNGAEKLYEQGEYWETLEKIEEIEEISKGMKSAKIQNLKVKAYLGAGMYGQSKEELDKLYNMNLDDEVLEEIASYESKIDQGIEKEKARKERKRLAEIKREEDEKLAEINKINEKKAKLEKRKWKYEKFKSRYDLDSNYFLDINEGNKLGLVSKDGEIIVPYEFDNIGFGYSQFSENIFDIEKGGYHYLLNVQSGQIILKELKYIFKRVEGITWEIATKSGKEGLINSRGRPITKSLYDGIGDWGKNGCAIVWNYTGREDKHSFIILDYGVIDTSGNEIIPLRKFSYISQFYEGLAIARNYSEKVGFINSKGEVVISFIYEEAGPFSKNGFAKVSKNGKKYFYINKLGEKIK